MTRPGITPSTVGTPKLLRTRPPSSLSRVNGRLWWPAKDACLLAESELTPITSAPASVNTSWLSRNAQASAVQPLVSSLG